MASPTKTQPPSQPVLNNECLFILKFKDVPKGVLKIADYLKSNDAKLKIKTGMLHGKRTEYFKGTDECKGKSGFNALMRPSFVATMKIAVTEDEAKDLMKQILEFGMILKISIDGSQLSISKDQVFSEDGFFVWVYEGSKLKSILMGVGVLAVVFAGVLFPLWPAFLRQGVYYLSMGALGLLGVLMALIVVRLGIYITTLLFCQRAGWLYPNLFADVGILESFQPMWEWEKVKKGKKKIAKDE